ncbi:hypothetical protein DL546_006052 [Coniochaeta pulveracea]|uniref:Uncharacterized protein n=1 Tax=Coniochaeta pulveracea TaxID=177199 RepID=A0A420YNN9_9PEZI|nr:hypothetical protein DL546_006052 [Coniochaeta pulveracea]
MHDPSAYDPYLDPSSYNLDQPQTAYTQEKHNGQYVEVIQQSDEHQGLHPKPATTMSSDAATFRTITWPDGPRFVKQSRVIHALTFFLDAILVLVALLFLVLAIMALRFAHEPAQSDLAVTIAQAMKLGPTIYPVLFAALLGRALKGIGRWRAERGTRVTNLWPLFNNKTMFDALISQWHLAQFNTVASLILLLWALSPLGGQASLRLMYRTNITTHYDLNLRYMDTGPLGNMFVKNVLIDGNDLELNSQGLPLTMPALYHASLLQSLDVKRSPLDVWGNIKIPRIDKFDSAAMDADGWVNISTTGSVEMYTALLGLPILHLPQLGDVEFTVESIYVALDPPKEAFFGPVRWYTGNFSAYQYTGLNITCLDCYNYAHYPAGIDPETAEYRQELLYGQTDERTNAAFMANTSVSGPRSIRFDQGTKAGDLSQAGTASAIFEVKQYFIETEIRCSAGKCAASRVRRSTTDHRTQNVTSFDVWGTFALDMITSFSNAVAQSVSSPSELFLNDSNASPVKIGIQDYQMVNMTTIDPELLADRGSMLLNTALQVFMAPAGFNGDLPSSNMSLYGPPHIPADGGNMSGISQMAPFVGANTTAKVTEFFEVIQPDYAWVVVLLLSSAALVSVGIAGMWLGYHVKGPDVFDPLMGLTYNNPHLNIPGHHSTLSASDRARLLKDLTVRLGDVHPYSELGKISLGQTAEVKRLVKGRLYE